MIEKLENNNETILINETLNINDNNIEQIITNKEEYSTKDKIIYILKGISSIISSIIHTFGYFAVYMLGYTTSYLISFRRNYNKKIAHSYQYFFIPIMHISFSFTSPISGLIEDKYGGRITIIVSDLILIGSFYLMYYSRSIYIDYLLFFIIGFGIAVGYNITRKNACSFFMNRKALICGIIYLVSNILCFGISFYFEMDILNYEVAPPYVEELYYPKRIYMNYQILLIFLIKFLIVTGLASVVLFFQNDPKETLKFGFNEKEQIDNNNQTNEDNIKKKKKKMSKKRKIKKAIYNKRTIKLIIIIFSFFPTINFICNIMRISLYLYFFYELGFNIVGSIAYLLFTIIGDCFQFRTLFVFLSTLLTGTSFMFIFYFNNEEFFLVLGVILVSFIFSGFSIIYDRHIMNVYGREIFLEIWGIIGGFGGISEILGIILYLILDEFSYIYKIVYFILGCLNIVSLLLVISEKDEKFNYDE